jgi:hypothetical protein
MLAVEILLPEPKASFPETFIYMLNRNDPQPEGDTIAIFSLAAGEGQPELVNEVHTGMRLDWPTLPQPLASLAVSGISRLVRHGSSARTHLGILNDTAFWCSCECIDCERRTGNKCVGCRECFYVSPSFPASD